MNAGRRIEPYIRSKFGNKYKKGKSRNGIEYKVCCPFCTRNGLRPDRKYKLWINPQKEVYRCWRCDTRGQLDDLFGSIAGLGSNPFQQNKVEPLAKTKVMPGQVMSLAELDDDNLAFRYMQRRGFDPVALGEFYGLCFCYEGRYFGTGKFQFSTYNTIIFPIWMRGEVVGWQARLLYNPDELTEDECKAMMFPVDDDGDYIKPPKYFTSPGLEKGRVLYNYDVAKTSQIVVVTEGPTDVLASGPCAVGTLGKSVSEEQTRLIKDGWDVAIILLDPGDADKEAYSLYRNLATDIHTVVVTLQGYSDPGCTTTAEIWRQIDKAAQQQGIDLSDYNWGTYWCDKVLKRR